MTKVEKILEVAEVDDNNVAAALVLLHGITPGVSFDNAFALIHEVATRLIAEVLKLHERIDDIELSGSDSEELKAALTCETCGVLHKVECRGLGG